MCLTLKTKNPKIKTAWMSGPSPIGGMERDPGEVPGPASEPSPSPQCPKRVFS